MTNMRRVILKMILSLDGFATSPDGTHEWMFDWFEPEARALSLRDLEEAGVHVMGRRSYETMSPYWLSSDGPMATSMNEKPKAVFSQTLEHGDWGPVEFHGGDLDAEIADLRSRDEEGIILVHGGPNLASSLTRLGLIDEYRLTTVPIFLGAGHGPFTELSEPLALEIVEERRFSKGALRQVLVPQR